MSLLLMSGGIDSAVLATKLVKDGVKFTAMFFDVGQDSRNMELWSARKTLREFSVPLIVVPIAGLDTIFRGLAGPGHSFGTLKKGDPDPDGNFECNDWYSLYGIAAEYAILNFHKEVYAGLSKNDTNRNGNLKKVVDLLTDAINLLYKDAIAKGGHGSPIITSLPFIDMTKGEIIELGSKLGVKFGRTWSCSRNGYTPCGKCPGCVERTDYFNAVQIEDPLSKRN